MTVVSISEAARLVGKSRTTVQKYIKQGKLSKCSGGNDFIGIDTSELIRVFGSISGHQVACTDDSSSVQDFAGKNDKYVQVSADVYTKTEQDLAVKNNENESLKREINLLKALLDEKDKRLLLLEHKEETKKENRGWLSRVFNSNK